MKLNLRFLLTAATAVLFGVGDAPAQTVITGPNITTSTWSPSGSPYIIAADCTVPAGNSLTIQPGTVVWIGQGLSLTNNGMISAVGTADQRINFQSPNGSQYWNTIIAQGTVGTNQFMYCDFSNSTNALDFRGASRNEVMYCTFSNATTAVTFRDNSVNTALHCSFQNLVNGVWLTVFANNWSQNSSIYNCSFTNISGQAIYGETIGHAGRTCGANYCYNWSQDALIVADVRNCSFSGVGAGCRFNSSGYGFTIPQQGGATGYGYGNVRMFNNRFNNVTNTAIWLSIGSYAGGGSATLINNTIVNAGRGIAVQDPWDAKVQSSLFVGCTNGVTRSGSLSATVSYNGFYENATNFSGYPGTYGLVILANRNGTPSDVLYNIFSNPLFVSASDFHLQTGSPAIDAGTPDWNYSDMCFTNGVSQGNSFPDLGAYGGPDAANWLDEVPLVSCEAFMTQTTNGVLKVNWGAIPRSEYQVQWTSNVLSAMTTNWFDVSNGWARATDKLTWVNVATNPPNAERYYRVQSLGRNPGN